MNKSLKLVQWTENDDTWRSFKSQFFAVVNTARISVFTRQNVVLVFHMHVCVCMCYTADVPFRFRYRDNVSMNGSVVLQFDSQTTSNNLLAMLHTGWFNKRFSAVVLEYNIYTAYSDLITQVFLGLYHLWHNLVLISRFASLPVAAEY